MTDIVIPAMYVNQSDAILTVEEVFNTDHFRMTLKVGDRIVADADGFRPGAASDFGEGWEDHTAQTFGAFLAHALEDEEAREDWDVIADDADEWTDALALFGESEQYR